MGKNHPSREKSEGLRKPGSVWVPEKGRHLCQAALEVSQACMSLALLNVTCLMVPPLLCDAGAAYRITADAERWRQQKEKLWRSVMEMTGQNGLQ